MFNHPINLTAFCTKLFILPENRNIFLRPGFMIIFLHSTHKNRDFNRIGAVNFEDIFFFSRYTGGIPPHQERTDSRDNKCNDKRSSV